MRSPVDVEREELVVGMALVPGLWSRNRSFALFEDTEVRRARRRAGALRGMVRQLADYHENVEALRIAYGPSGCELSYSIPGMKMRRHASLSELELACVRYLAQRAGVSGLRVSDEDRLGIDAALRRLAVGLRLEQVDVGKSS